MSKSDFEPQPGKMACAFIPAYPEILNGHVLGDIGAMDRPDLKILRHLLLLLGWQADAVRARYESMLVVIHDPGSEDPDQPIGYVLCVQCEDVEVTQEVRNPGGRPRSRSRTAQQMNADLEAAAEEEAAATEYVNFHELLQRAQRNYEMLARFTEEDPNTEPVFTNSSGSKRAKMGSRRVVTFEGIIPQRYIQTYPMGREISSAEVFGSIAQSVHPEVFYLTPWGFGPAGITRSMGHGALLKRLETFLRSKHLENHPVLDLFHDMGAGGGLLRLPQQFHDGMYEVYDAKHITKSLASSLTTRLPQGAFGPSVPPMDLLAVRNAIGEHNPRYKLPGDMMEHEIIAATYGDTFFPWPESCDEEWRRKYYIPMVPSVPLYVERVESIVGRQGDFLAIYKYTGAAHDDITRDAEEITDLITRIFKASVGSPNTPKGIIEMYSVLRECFPCLVSTHEDEWLRVTPHDMLQFVPKEILRILQLYSPVGGNACAVAHDGYTCTCAIASEGLHNHTLLYGESQTGKSVIINLIAWFMGNAAVSGTKITKGMLASWSSMKQFHFLLLAEVMAEARTEKGQSRTVGGDKEEKMAGLLRGTDNHRDGSTRLTHNQESGGFEEDKSNVGGMLPMLTHWTAANQLYDAHVRPRARRWPGTRGSRLHCAGKADYA